MFYGRRAGEERLAAMRSAHPAVREAHLEMARRYDHLVEALTKGEEQHLSVNSAA
jgi:predicted secreted Zn-dependent protease